MVVNVGYALRPFPGETVCGDRCGWWRVGERIVLAAADGLGHGREAAYAAEMALDCIAQHLHASCEEIFLHCDERLRNTRGVALAVAIVEINRNRLTIATVGNIRALLLGDTADLRLDGGRGIVGAGYKHLLPETYDLAPGQILVLFSDGLDELAVPRECLVDESLSTEDQAQAMIDRWGRDDDDASVLVYRHGLEG